MSYQPPGSGQYFPSIYPLQHTSQSSPLQPQQLQQLQAQQYQHGIATGAQYPAYAKQAIYPQTVIPPSFQYPQQQHTGFYPAQTNPARSSTPENAALPYSGGALDQPYAVPPRTGAYPTAPVLPPSQQYYTSFPSQPIRMQPQFSALHQQPPPTPQLSYYPQTKGFENPPSLPPSLRTVNEQPRSYPVALDKAVQKEPSTKLKRSMSPTKEKNQKPKIEQQTQEAAVSQKQEIDYSALLLSLADEYFDAAHSQGRSLAISNENDELDEYYKLVATGLGCLEAVLKNWRLPPRNEALIRLQYARILYEETENDFEAETALTKGIDLCERNKMVDLKYSMQQLLARVLFKTNPKVALKLIDGIIQDVETYRHTAWEYAFGFLKASLSLELPSHHDITAAVHILHKISTLANRNSDKVVLVVSSILEALAHLQMSSSPDAIEQAQRAVALARSRQLDTELQNIPQINSMIQIVDIACSLLEYDMVQSIQKLQVLQKLMDQNINNSHWNDDGSFQVPMSTNTISPSLVDQTNILRIDENGRGALVMSWLPQHDLYALCYFLSSVTLTAKNSQDGHKAEKFLREGLRMIKNSYKSPQGSSDSLSLTSSRLKWGRHLHSNMLLQLIFLACARSDWTIAKQTLKELRHMIKPSKDEFLSGSIDFLVEYATGVISQATGDLQSALLVFRKPIFDLGQFKSKNARNDPRRDVSILAAINTVLIERDSSSPSAVTTDLLSVLNTFCRNSPSKYIQAAYYTLSATTQTGSLQTRHELHHALQAATAISNSQITCICLTFMSWRYFRGVVGEQSEKSAMAARAMAGKADDRLWISVTEELLASTLDSQGKPNQARASRDAADQVLAQLPPVLKSVNEPS